MKDEPRRRQGPERPSGQQEEETASGRTKVVVIGEGLHGLLKVRAAREGKSLQSLVESKLGELVTAELNPTGGNGR